MTGVAVSLALLSQLCLVVGQILIKRGMSSRIVKMTALVLGITCLTGWFFLWMGLLAKWDLSRIFPFEGMNPVMVVVGAALFLRERVTPAGWIGVALISAGIAIISSS